MQRFCATWLVVVFVVSAISQAFGNLILNPSAEMPLVGGNLPYWTEVTGTGWTRSTWVPARDGIYHFWSGWDTTAPELRQDVALSAADWGWPATFSGYVRSWDQAPADTSRIVVEYWGASSILSSFDTGEIASTAGWQMVSDSRIVPENTLFARVRLLPVRYGEEFSDNDGYFDALSLAVPEPTAAGALLVASCGLLRRRKGR